MSCWRAIVTALAAVACRAPTTDAPARQIPLAAAVPGDAATITVVAAVDAPPVVAPLPPGTGITARLRSGPDPALLVWNPDAIEARTVDGRLIMTLAPGRIAYVAWDRLLELIWFVRDNTLFVLDLRAPVDTPPVAIVADEGGFPFRIRGRASWISSSGPNLGIEQNLRWQDGRPELAIEEFTVCQSLMCGPGESVASRKLNRRLKRVAVRAKIVGTAWLAEHAQREPRVDTRKSSRVDDPGIAVALPPNRDRCVPGEHGLCGHAVPLGATGWWVARVDRWMSWDGCVLYDPATRRYAPIDEPARWSAGETRSVFCSTGFELDHARQLYFTHVSSFGEQVSRPVACDRTACHALGNILGWLDPGELLFSF